MTTAGSVKTPKKFQNVYVTELVACGKNIKLCMSCENDNYTFLKAPLCLALSNSYRLNKLQAGR